MADETVIPPEALAAYAAATGAELPPPVATEPDDTPPGGKTRKKRSDAGVPRGPRGAGGSRKAASKAQVEKKLGELARTIGGLVSVADTFDGSVILANADNLASSWAEIADRHPRFRQAIEGLESGGVYGAAVLSVLMVAIPILGHHNMLPDPMRPLAVMFTPKVNNGGNPAAGFTFV